MGFSRRARLPETMGILDVKLTAGELAVLDKALAPDAILGDRNPLPLQKLAAR